MLLASDAVLSVSARTALAAQVDHYLLGPVIENPQETPLTVKMVETAKAGMRS